MEVIEALKILKEHCSNIERCAEDECEVRKILGTCVDIRYAPKDWNIKE